MQKHPYTMSFMKGAGLFQLLAALMFVSCTVEELENPQSPEPEPEFQEQVQKVRITFTGDRMVAPCITGEDLGDGLISWGDGFFDQYGDGVSHVYESEKEYVVTVSASGADEISFGNITGISELDLSGF